MTLFPNKDTFWGPGGYNIILFFCRDTIQPTTVVINIWLKIMPMTIAQGFAYPG